MWFKNLSLNVCVLNIQYWIITGFQTSCGVTKSCWYVLSWDLNWVQRDRSIWKSISRKCVSLQYVLLNDLKDEDKKEQLGFQHAFLYFVELFFQYFNIIQMRQNMECLKSEKIYKIKRSYKEVNKHFLNKGRVFRGNTHFPCFLKFVFLEPRWKGNFYCYKNVINNTVPVLYRWSIWLESCHRL